jgi:hypothetical protein
VKFVPDYTGKDYFDEIKKYVEIKEINTEDYHIKGDIPEILKSDIFRYNILHEKGGIWSDFDVLWIKPIEHILNINSYVADSKIEEMEGCVCMHYTTSGFHSIAVLIFAQKSRFLETLIKRTTYLQGEEKIKYQKFGTNMLNELFPTYNDIRIQYKNIIALPYATFYPYDTQKLQTLYSDNELRYLKMSTVGIHWFNGSTLAKDYVNNGLFKPCSMTTILKKEGWL